MTINYDQLIDIENTLKEFPNAKLQIVTKNRDVKIINELIDKGYYLFGENKVQEAQEKFKSINDPRVELHLIGPLQTNKVKMALNIFHCIQSIDREKLVNEISKNIFKEKSKTKSFYIQINIGKESQKSGVYPENLKDLYELCIEKKLFIRGLMCIPPFVDDTKIYFEKMVKIKNGTNLSELSMGMSNDYMVAAKYSATYVRIGSKIFGNRIK